MATRSARGAPLAGGPQLLPGALGPDGGAEGPEGLGASPQRDPRVRTAPVAPQVLAQGQLGARQAGTRGDRACRSRPRAAPPRRPRHHRAPRGGGGRPPAQAVPVPSANSDSSSATPRPGRGGPRSAAPSIPVSAAVPRTTGSWICSRWCSTVPGETGLSGGGPVGQAGDERGCDPRGRCCSVTAASSSSRRGAWASPRSADTTASSTSGSGPARRAGLRSSTSASCAAEAASLRRRWRSGRSHPLAERVLDH